MKIGTRSLLFGAHQVVWHPITVYIAWCALYGHPTFRETLCIIIHDWGYWGCPDMDGKNGELHPLWAAKQAKRLGTYYSELCLYHSRTIAKKYGHTPSKLCWADKLSMAYDPAKFYLWRTKTSTRVARIP